MSSFPCLVRFVPGSGQVRYRLGDHARDHGQPDRAALFDGLIQRAEDGPATTNTGRS